MEPQGYPKETPNHPKSEKMRPMTPPKRVWRPGLEKVASQTLPKIPLYRENTAPTMLFTLPRGRPQSHFYANFGSILKPKLGPCKLRFRLKWRDVLARRPLFCCPGSFFLLFRRFDSNLAPFGLHLSGSGTRLGSIWKVFGPIMVPSWRYLGPLEKEI